MSDEVKRTDAQWRALLTPMQYEVLRNKGTERDYWATWNEKRPVLRLRGRQKSSSR